MAVEHQSTGEDMDALRARVEALERELEERTVRANAAVARAQDQTYWLERWHLDLNALMRRRGASEARAAVRGVRSAYRFMHDLRRRAREQLDSIPLRMQATRRIVAEERARAEATTELRFERAISPDPLAASPVTDLLYDRLEPGDVAEVERSLQPAEASHWEAAAGAERRRLVLAYAALYGIRPALERTGLSDAMPDPSVHAMTRGARSAGGSTYYADLVVDAVQEVGAAPSPGQSVLDFGCSSGRVVRVLAAAFPEVEWHGCDPQRDAIEWAANHLAGITFARSSEVPPLAYPDELFSIVIAISIWSHFEAERALAWLDEMRRVLEPGGRLLLTTHGEATLAHAERAGTREPEQLAEIRGALYRDGHWFTVEFGEAGDHGILDPGWGTAFLTPEWMATRTTPAWRVALYRPGRVKDNQDLYVLERR